MAQMMGKIEIEMSEEAHNDIERLVKAVERLDELLEEHNGR